MVDVVTICSPSLQFSLLPEVLRVETHCLVRKKTYFCPNLVAFCGLLVVIDQTVIYSNSLHSQRVLEAESPQEQLEI